MDTLRTVELRTAYAFDCDECGRENFVRAVIHEFSPEEAAEVAEMGIEGPIGGQWVTIPDEVACVHCNAKFSTQDARSSA